MWVKLSVLFMASRRFHVLIYVWLVMLLCVKKDITVRLDQFLRHKMNVVVVPITVHVDHPYEPRSLLDIIQHRLVQQEQRIDRVNWNVLEVVIVLVV